MVAPVPQQADKGESGIGIRPIVSLLEKFPELNARWLLLGEGAMITSAADEVRKRLARLLEIEKYMPVMTPDELREVTEGDCQFDLQTVNKWNTLLEKETRKPTTASLRLIKGRRNYADRTKPGNHQTLLRGVAGLIEIRLSVASRLSPHGTG